MAGLVETRLAAQEDLIDARLRLGDHRDLLDELTGLVAEHPHRERLVRQLMLALYRSGRQSEALVVYRRTREWLAEELGLDPGEDLRRLELAILRGDPGMARPPTPADTKQTSARSQSPAGGSARHVREDRRGRLGPAMPDGHVPRRRRFSHSPPLSSYTAPRGLRQDPGHAA